MSQKQHHFPVKSLNMGSDEHAFVLVGKMRPAIVLIEDTTQWAKSPAENLALCIPLYRVSKAKFLPEFCFESASVPIPEQILLARRFELSA